MGLASIKVVLNTGEFSHARHLHDFAEKIYSNKVGFADDELTGYRKIISQSSIYTCSPRPGATAFFLSTSVKEFEVFIMTSSHGHMFGSTEAVVRAILHELKITDRHADITISVKDYDDDQIYIIGRIIGRFEFLLKSVSDHLTMTTITLVFIPISHQWLTSYFQESLVAFFTTLVMLSLSIRKAWIEARGITNIQWSTTRENGG